MISYSSKRIIISVISLTAFSALSGCIGQPYGENRQADDLLGQDEQALQVVDGSDDGIASDFPFEDTYQDGNFSDIDSVIQGDVATEPMEEVTVTATRLPNDPDIEALNLSSTTAYFAYWLKDRHPTIRFTSGHRSITSQARAMAANVLRQRQWIALTYSDTPLRNALQQWVNNHPNATGAEIQTGLLSVFAAASPADVASFSNHLSGNAFDVQPVDGAVGAAIQSDLNNLPGLFLDHEGGLRRWHYQD
jgi:hypothetical protein